MVADPDLLFGNEEIRHVKGNPSRYEMDLVFPDSVWLDFFDTMDEVMKEGWNVERQQRWDNIVKGVIVVCQGNVTSHDQCTSEKGDRETFEEQM
jgi:hypothetical protein